MPSRHDTRTWVKENSWRGKKRWLSRRIEILCFVMCISWWLLLLLFCWVGFAEFCLLVRWQHTQYNSITVIAVCSFCQRFLLNSSILWSSLVSLPLLLFSLPPTLFFTISSQVSITNVSITELQKHFVIEADVTSSIVIIWKKTTVKSYRISIKQELLEEWSH